nr:unnamed protein product [Hydra vulgaris]
MVKMKSLLSKKCFCGFLIILLECFKHLYAIDQPYKYENPKLQNIHRSMKKRDLSRIFAIEDSNDVPDYHIVVPFQLDLYSSIGRNKRELSDKEPIHFTFGISAYDIDFKFNLSLNKHLLGPNFKIEIKGKNGTIEKKAKNCYYSGKVNGNDESVAGISTCNGLSGIFKYNNHDYFIDPVPKYLHKFHQSKNKVLNTKVKSKKSPSKHSADLKYFQPHIIYRRSLNGVYEDHQTLSETFSRFMHKNMMKQCATKGRPPYSLQVLRFALMQRYSSFQAYSLLLKQLPLPSMSLLKKLVSGGIDSIKSLKLLLNEGKISNDCVLLFDEMYLQQSCEYHNRRLFGQDTKGNLYKGIIVFMIVGLKKSIPYWVISNSKMKYSNHKFGNASVMGDGKPQFLRAFAHWIDQWQNSQYSSIERYSLTAQTSKALIATLQSTSSLIEDLLFEG